MLGISFADAAIFHYLILMLVIAGTVRLFIKKNRSSLLLFISVLFFNLIYLPYLTMPRYSYPIMTMIFIIAGYEIYEFIIRRFRFGQAEDTNC